MIYTVTLNPALVKQLTVPEIARNTVLCATDSRTDIGGKGFNISRMLRSLGDRSTAIAFAGGHTGLRLEQGLHELGIATAFVRVPEETRTNISIVNPGYEDYIKVNESGPIIPSEAQAEILNLVAELAVRGSWWTLSGSAFLCKQAITNPPRIVHHEFGDFAPYIGEILSELHWDQWSRLARNGQHPAFSHLSRSHVP